MNSSSMLSASYWQSLRVNKRDADFLLAYLFELETPQKTANLLTAFIEERARYEKEVLLKKRKGLGKVYLPREIYKVGDELAFPALNWQKGEVLSLRDGVNPIVGEFQVMTVKMEKGEERTFAMGIDAHELNNDDPTVDSDEDVDVNEILAQFGKSLHEKLVSYFRDGDELVSLADHWFPRSLLVDVNVGHLNLAEAILDMAEGQPLETSAIMKDIDFEQGDNPALTEFSLNYALQEDPRFDEVGSTGKVLWCLQRLEPIEVREVPKMLHYEPVELDRSTLSKEMLALEAKLDDELSKIQLGDEKPYKATVSLLYPHWRLGTFPISERLRSFFPSAYESPRIRFTFVDGDSGKKMPAWVVKDNRYAFGLKEWYEDKGLAPGSLIDIQHGEAPGEVLVNAHTHRSKRDWVRTVIVGTDGGLVFATLKNVINAKFDPRMILGITDVNAMDRAWELAQAKKQPFDALIRSIMLELMKLNPQGHVHAQELYSAVNLLRRCPPAPLFSFLATSPWVEHVGDLYFRLNDDATSKEA